MMTQQLKVAIEALHVAGTILLDAQQSERGLRHKTVEDGVYDSRKQFITDTDLKCESAIKGLLSGAFPNYGFLTEENAPENLSCEHVWVVDPIDGTLSYAHGLDSYVTAVALLRQGQVVLGAVYQPEKNELFYAEQGGGAYLNGKRLHVGGEQNLARSIVSLDHRMLRIEDYPKVRHRLVKDVRRVRVSESCSQELCYLAAGKTDAFIRTLQPTYDYAMGKIIVEEAGGILTDFRGLPLYLWLNTERNTNIVAGNPELAKALLEYVH